MSLCSPVNRSRLGASRLAACRLVAGRLQIASRHWVGGVGAWRLGQEDPAVWPLLADYRVGK